MTVHIIGGGVAGLAAAVACTRQGQHVRLYEAAPELGGRARTYYSAALNMNIDNGAHAVLRNNTSVHDYLVLSGASHELTAYGTDGLAFYDVRSRTLSRFKLPDALWTKTARPTGMTPIDLLAGLKLLMARRGVTAAKALNARQAAIETLWEPLCTAALNTPLAEASASTLARVVREMALEDGLRAGLLLPKVALSETYVTPAVQWLTERGTQIERGTPLRALQTNGRRVTALAFDAPVLVGPDDSVILALPPWAHILRVAGVDTAAFTYAPIVNVHFRLPSPVSPQFTALVGGQAQWLWARDQVASVTISAADDLQDEDSHVIAERLWAEIAPCLGMPEAVPAAHVIKERRATLRHTPGLDRARSGPATNFANLFLAGDWVIADRQRPLPCTLESAIGSGFAAAKRAAEG